MYGCFAKKPSCFSILVSESGRSPLIHGDPNHGAPWQSVQCLPLFVAKMGKEDTSGTGKVTLQNRNTVAILQMIKNFAWNWLKQSYRGGQDLGDLVHSCHEFLVFLPEFHENLNLQNCKPFYPLSWSPSALLVYSRLHEMTVPYEVIGVVHILRPKWLQMLEGNFQPWLGLAIVMNHSSLPQPFYISVVLVS